LDGLSIDAVSHLFTKRGAKCQHQEIVEAHQLTEGHAFWLDLLAIQTAKNPSVHLQTFLDRIRSGTGELPSKTLSSIWSTLSDRERLVLRSMSETVRPATEFEIADYVSDHLTYQKVMRAIRALKALNLVVVKRRPPAADVLELHPLVRRFVHRTFSPLERSSFIEQILRAFSTFVGNHRAQLGQRPSFSTLEYWTQTAELDIAAGRIADAISILLEVADPFSMSAYTREFSRVMRLLLKTTDWISEHEKYPHFDAVFAYHVKALAELGEVQEVNDLLDMYELTVMDKDARYILYCAMKCECLWNRGQFKEAVMWGTRGQKLKASSKIDTGYDVGHELALAQRDAGQPDVALSYFLAGRNLQEVINPEELDQSRSGHHYGNVGRCLHFMGQVDSALICYQKSAVLIEKDSKTEHVSHQGYIRQWIGELMLARKQYRLAAVFLEAARAKWKQVSPPRQVQVEALQTQYQGQLPQLNLSTDELEAMCREWFVGSYMDAQAG
jgi:tetratricopeptide (TPR) repeat protein